MKIIIAEIGDHIEIRFTGKGKKSDRIKLLMMVMVETLVDGLVSRLDRCTAAGCSKHICQ